MIAPAARGGHEAPPPQQEEQATPRLPETAMEGQVRFDDEKLIGMAFVMMGLAGV